MHRERRKISSKFLMAILILLSCFALTACGAKTSTKGSTAKGNAISKTAQSQIGKYYKFGGTSPKTGFDCSGLIMWSYNKHGISMPRNTKQQATVGKKVTSKKAKPGDIVVFRSKYTSSGYHTGIYIGNNKFVHSPKTGSKIRIESFNSYWKPKISSFRRVVN